MDTIGLLDERHDEVDDLERARRLPSAQLIGTPERRTLDLNTLHAAGVEIAGRLVGITGDRAQFSGSLANHVASADLKLGRLLDRIDRHVAEHDLAHDRPGRPPPNDTAARRHHRDPTRSLRHRRLGHRLPATPPLARPDAPRPPRTDPPPRRRHATFPVSTCSACRSPDAATPASSTASGPTPKSSPTTSSTTLHGGPPRRDDTHPAGGCAVVLPDIGRHIDASDLTDEVLAPEPVLPLRPRTVA